MDSYYSKLWNRISLQTCTSTQKPSFSFQLSSEQSPSIKHKRIPNRDLHPVRRVSSSSRYHNYEGLSNLHFSESRILISFDGSPSVQGAIPIKEDPQRSKVVWKEKVNSAILRLKRKIRSQQRELHSVNIENEATNIIDKTEKKPKGYSKSLSKKTVEIEEIGTDETIMHLCELGKTSPVKKNKKAISHVDFHALRGKSEGLGENKCKRGSIQEKSPNNKREKANPQRMRTEGKLKLKKAMTQDTISVPSSNMKSTNDDLGAKVKNSRQRSSCFAQTNDKTSEDCGSSLSRNRSRTQSLFPNENPFKDKKLSPVIKPITQGLDLKALNLRKFKAFTTEKGPRVVSMIASQNENQSALIDSKKPILSYTATGSPCRQEEKEEEEAQMTNFNLLEDSEADEVVMFETSGWAAEIKEEEKEKIFNGEDYLRAIVSKLKKENKDGGEKKKVNDIRDAEGVRQTINTRNVNNYLKCRRKDCTPGK